MPVTAFDFRFHTGRTTAVTTGAANLLTAHASTRIRSFDMQEEALHPRLPGECASRLRRLSERRFARLRHFAVAFPSFVFKLDVLDRNRVCIGV